jgi:hypothetical protein
LYPEVMVLVLELVWVQV